MGGRPIGYQPLRAGLHRPWVGPRTVNINHKETTINNFGGGFFPMGAYGYYDTGLSKGEKWGIALGAIGTLGGAIASALLPQKADGKGDVETPAQDGLSNEQKQWMEDTQEQLNQMQKSLEQLTEENTKLKAQAQEIQNIRAASQAYQKQHTAGAEEIKQEPEFATFTVTAEKDGDKVTGHTGYNIVAKKYKSADGKPLTSSDIKAICNEIFKGKALPTGEIQLPLEVEVNGKTYTYDKSVPDESVPTSTYTLAKNDTYKPDVQQVGSKFAPTVDGERHGSAVYDTKQEALDAANAAINELKTQDEAN